MIHNLIKDVYATPGSMWYIHSAVSATVYHRDGTTTNIRLVHASTTDHFMTQGV